jgi:Putative auto-transporter adhesin, head GIN domain
MKALRLTLSLLLLAACLTACIAIPTGNRQIIEGSGTLAEETRAINGISAVQLSMQGTLHIEIGSTASLRVSAEDNLLPSIETNVHGGELEIRATPDVDLRPRQPIDYYLTVPSLDRIGISSSGDVEAGALTTSHFEAAISSSGSLSIESLQAETVNVEISSSGSLTIAGGAVQSQTVRISSSGDYGAKELQSDEASVRLTSSGSATIRVLNRLEGNLTSSGNVYYLGSPQVTVDTSSSGRAVQIGG